MIPYIVALTDADKQIAIVVRCASSIEILIDKLALSVGDELIGIREFAFDEIDGLACATHCPTFSENAILVASDRQGSRKLASAFLLRIEDRETGKMTEIVRFGQSVAQTLRVFSVRNGIASAALSEYGEKARVVAIRQISNNEIEELVSHSIRPKW